MKQLKIDLPITGKSAVFDLQPLAAHLNPGIRASIHDEIDRRGARKPDKEPKQQEIA
jgi:hypothetical protein